MDDQLEYADRVIRTDLKDEVRESYLRYAMSVIVARALPDVRDGMKPVHRRILYAMHELGLEPTKKYRKSANTVGDVLSKYHPHGDAAIYMTMVRMAQDFSMRYPLVDGQGNFGSLDGDNPAAMRYTEARMTAIASEMMSDINKDTVDFVANYDDTREEPAVLPAGVPALLINGAEGIAVGMATKMPPHNLREIIDACIKVIDEPECTVQDLSKIVRGPDFPTGATIYGREGIKQAYETGRGRLIVRAKMDIEIVKKKKEAIVVTEIPYQVNKANLMERIAALVNDRKIEGIGELRDESTKTVRIVIELKSGGNAQVIMNQLLAHTQLQVTFGVINLALVDKQPLELSLKELIVHYVAHRKDVLIRRCKFDLQKAEARAHILRGYLIAIDAIDLVIQIIRSSREDAESRAELMRQLELSEVQANAILDMRLKRLQQLEIKKIQDELEEIEKLIEKLKAILASDELQYDEIKKHLRDMREKYGDDRRTEIVDESAELSEEDIIVRSNMVITITQTGYIKRTEVSQYRKQKRGGRGAAATSTTSDDVISTMFVASTHDYLLCFSSQGRAFYLKVHEVPEVGRTARGRSLKLMLQLRPDEEIMTVLATDDFHEDRYIVMGTAFGVVKKSALPDFINAKTRGIIGINLQEGDHLIGACLTTGEQELMICSSGGKALRLSETEIREMGRSSQGVRGLKLPANQRMIALMLYHDDRKLLIATQKGYGKLTSQSEFSPHGRGTAGQMYIKTTPKTGPVQAVVGVDPGDVAFLVTRGGMVVKMDVDGISTYGRAAAGLRLIKLRSDDEVALVAKYRQDEDSDEEPEAPTNGGPPPSSQEDLFKG